MKAYANEIGGRRGRARRLLECLRRSRARARIHSAILQPFVKAGREHERRAPQRTAEKGGRMAKGAKPRQGGKQRRRK
jgi:hypothetical protein